MCRCALTCHDLSLWHSEPWRFVTTQWQYPGRKSYSYVCYRLTVAVFFLLWTVTDMATYGSAGQRSSWLIHITNWSKLFVMIDVLLQATFTCHYQLWKLRTRPPGSQVQRAVSFSWILRLFYGIQWLFTTISGVFVVVTVNIAFLEADSSGPFHAARYFSSLLYVVVDHLVHNQPKHMLHVFYALFLHLFYVAFNALYVLAGGTTASGSSVIDAIDWSHAATTAAFVTLSVMLVFLAHAGLWLLVRLRELLYSCVSADSEIKLPLNATGPPPYGATRQDPEGAHPSPVTEKRQRNVEDSDTLATSGPAPTSPRHSTYDPATEPSAPSHEPATEPRDPGHDPELESTRGPTEPEPSDQPPVTSRDLTGSPTDHARDPVFTRQRYHSPAQQ